MVGCPHCPPALEASSKIKTAHILHIRSDHPIVKELGIASFPTIWVSLPNSLFDYGAKPRDTPSLEQFVMDKISNNNPF